MNVKSKTNPSYMLGFVFLSISLVSAASLTDSSYTAPKEKVLLEESWPKEITPRVAVRALNSYKMSLKPGVQMEGISPRWLHFFVKIEKALPDLPLTWVSGIEGLSHRKNRESHYEGLRLDLRIKDWPMVLIEKRRIVEGWQLLDEVLENLNKIKGLKATVFEGRDYPFIELELNP